MLNETQLPISEDTTLRAYVNYDGMIKSTIWHMHVGQGQLTMTREQAREWGKKLIALSQADFIKGEEIVCNGYQPEIKR